MSNLFLKMKNSSHTIPALTLSSGATLQEIVIAYNTMGELSPDGCNAVLLTHGYTSGQDMALPGSSAVEGSWCEIVGPGKPIDTDRFFVVCPNMLGSSYGSTNAASVNPATGRPYGSSFPDITLADIVETQRSLVDALGIKKLVAVVGPSFGGFQAFQWAISYPDFVDGIAALTSAPFCPAADVAGIAKRLSSDPNWNGGDYYSGPGVKSTVAKMRSETLKVFGIDAVLERQFPNAADRDVEIVRLAEEWADKFDANSMLILMKAAEVFDVRPHLDGVKARVFLALSSTDRLFPTTMAEEVMQAFVRAGVTAEYHEIDSQFGHFASGVDAEKWSELLRTFIARLTCR
ncbi:homoserine O-acetyltransferase family protein [Paraburkholderia pallida]|uniref:Alpha/beta fold hydrolase n=1 Tax=Paraburkholderia pallida TaxID=2547399 RepID=A0A4P7D8L0_9BURK|nr:alpha/beta fold hydrolase [Paraburkholderia pallida]QBR03757.1 alpha/beta fold hydrolase [Paraburkholderia pallida]